jgi:hypothetical protein
MSAVQLDKSESWYLMIFLLRVFQYAELYRSTDGISLHDSSLHDSMCAFVLVQDQWSYFDLTGRAYQFNEPKSCVNWHS